METNNIRLRFAPSPTGPLHVGGARTALFNYLYVKKMGGTLVLRIEDTDKERSRDEWEQDITENLEWLGLKWDEFYRQSDRTETYKGYLRKLLDENKAYHCFCSEEELEEMRQEQMSRGEAPRYTGTCRSLSAEEVVKRKEEGTSSVIRFRVPSKKVTFTDMIRGQVDMDAGLMGDIVIAKGMEYPLYNFTVVVDDHEMNITHIIRGEDHIPNTPKQILLQEALGFQVPEFAHLPLLLGEDRSKLSKRHGDNSVTKFREDGYLPEAMVNFLSLLGWNPGDDREEFTIDQLVEEFTMERVHKSGAVFQLRRLDWLNGTYIRKKTKEELAELALPHLVHSGLLTPLWGDRERGKIVGLLGRIITQEKFKIEETGEEITLDRVGDIVSLYQERLKRLSEVPELTRYFFVKQPEYDTELLLWKDMTKKVALGNLKRAEEIWAKVGDWSEGSLNKILMEEADKQESRGYLLWPLRVALTGKKASAGPFEVAFVLGRERSLERLRMAQEKLSSWSRE